MVPASTLVPMLRNGVVHGERCVPEEVAVALTYNRRTHAVMMATPSDLEDFAVGFSLAEGIIDDPADLAELAVVETVHGIELRMWIDPDRMARLEQRQRRMAGPTGCGLCGMDSLAEAMRRPPAVPSAREWAPEQIAAAASSLEGAQVLNRQTHGVHAAGFWRDELIAVREDIGRHNAVDKLVGALRRAGEAPSSGILLLTSRVSVELVQKAAIAGIGTLVAVSVPSALALRTSEAAGINLIAVARADGFERFTLLQQCG